MTTRTLLILTAVGSVAYLMMKKRNKPRAAKKPGMVSSFFNEIGESIKKPLDDVAEDISERPVRPGLHQTGLS